MFNESKYKKCINHLVEIKISIVLTYLIVFALIGVGVGIPIMLNLTDEFITIVIAGVIGAIVGLIIGLASTWRVEMKIQEAYWRIDMINEIKKQNSTKNTPVAKTVVAIENKQTPKEDSQTEVNKE